MSKNNQAQVGPKAVTASLSLVNKASAAFEGVVRMTTTEKRRAAKLKRGAQQVMPTIAQLANKFAVEVPGSSITDMQSKIEYAAALEPLLGAVSALHETLRDEYLRANSSSWKTASVTYAMLRHASKANQNLANELEPVRKWFRYNARSKKAAGGVTTTKPASTDANAISQNEPAKAIGPAKAAPSDAPMVNTTNGASANGAAN